MRVARAEGRHGTLELVWEYGRLVVNSPHANQSHGSLHRVWRHAFRVARVRELRPRHVLLLGLGTGSAVHILRHELGLPAPITAVEHDPRMLAWGRTHFGLDRVKDLVVVEGDALAEVPRLKGRFDLVVVDLFEDLALAQGIAEADFLEALEGRVAPGGSLLWNTIAQDAENAANADAIEAHLRGWARRLKRFRTQGINQVLIAQAPEEASGSS